MGGDLLGLVTCIEVDLVDMFRRNRARAAAIGVNTAQI